LTGDKPEIYKLARRSFFLTASDGDGGPNDFIHSDKLVLIDKENRIRGFYTGTDEKAVKQLMTGIKKLKYEK
jgi:protein SCO1/2